MNLTLVDTRNRSDAVVAILRSQGALVADSMRTGTTRPCKVLNDLPSLALASGAVDTESMLALVARSFAGRPILSCCLLHALVS